MQQFYAVAFFLLRKLPAIAANPATTPPIKAVTSTNKYGLSTFIIIIDTLSASICSFGLLIEKLKIPHNKNNARKPVRKLLPGD